MKPILALLALVSGQTFAAENFRDDFTQPKLAQRTPARGDWKFAGGVARCTQDDALYAKNKDHGPVLWYAVPFGDAVVHFAYRPEQVRSFVFTLNGAGGHVFRFVTGATGTTIVTFPPEDQTHRSKVLQRDGPPLKSGEWTEVRVELRGAQAVVRIGKDYAATVGHPAIARAKTTAGLGFASGTFSVKDFSIQAP